MHAAVARAYEAVPPRRVNEYRLSPRTATALYVFKPDCDACERFQARRAAFERDLGADHGVACVLPVNAERARERDLCLRAGVGGVPAYVLLLPGRRPSVVTPPL